MYPLIKFINALNFPQYSIFRPGYIDDLMKDCKVKYRNGKNIRDIVAVLQKRRQPVIVHGMMPAITLEWYGPHKTYSDIFEEIAEEMDKVLRIDWGAHYGATIPSIKFV